MFVETRLWADDDDYKRLIQNLDPPPPPGSDNLWELHFCKWWGWNWVKKREAEEEAPMQRSSASKPIEGKRPKKPIKHLCQSLCFKKKAKQQPLQDRYNTPSNSIIGSRHKNSKSSANSVHDVDTKKIQTIQNTYQQTLPNTVYQNGRTDSIVQQELEEQITKEVRRKVYEKPTEEKRMAKKESSTSSSEETSGPRGKSRSSSGESTEYINITCQCCHRCRQPPAGKKCDTQTTKRNEKATQDTRGQSAGKMISTQTEKKEKKHKRRRICIVCCCQCRQQNSHVCCSCCSSDDIAKNSQNPQGASPKPKPVEEPFIKKEAAASQDQRKWSGQSSDSQKNGKESSNLTKKFEPLYMTGMPIDTMLYHNKPITKFGVPSQSYSWLHSTKSDIFDSRLNCEYSSPVSGKSYNLSPIKLHELESKRSFVFNPMSIDEELENLKKIDDDIKMDRKSRLMLDLVCDAILAKNREVDASSSIFLKEFTYPSNVPPTECVIKDLFNTEEKDTCTKLNQTGLEGMIFEDISSKVNCETNTGTENLNIDHPLRDYLNIRSPQTYTLENPYKTLPHNPCITLNYNIDHSTPTGNVFTTNQPLVATQQQPILTRARLMSPSKRSASPTLGREIKKVKLEEPSTLENVSDIFRKIDNIVLRSKVNNEEIQNVLNTIPKRTYKFFTSWEVSNLMNQSFPLQSVGREGPVNASVNSISEDKKEKNDKTRTPQTKKKKVCSRPSMIPKRVVDSRLSKKNVS